MDIFQLETPRLLLREWQTEDYLPFAAMNADPRVMEYMPKLLTPEESVQLIRRIESHFQKHRFGLWAIALKETNTFVGYTGLLCPTFEAHFTPCIEIGWRLDFEHWNQGYATEAARRVLEYAFSDLKLNEVVSFTTVSNQRSRRVMEKLGMTYSSTDDFDHPHLETDHPLRHHVLYRLQGN